MGKRKQTESVKGLVEKLLAETSVPPSGPQLQQYWQKHLELRQLTERLTALQPENASEGNPNQRIQSISKFMQWAKDNGVDVDGIEISEFSGYSLGIRALKTIKEGNNVINIPRKLIMTEECAQNSLLGSFINKDPILKLMPNITLVIYLLFEKFSPDSFWKPYIDILPKSYDTVLYFSKDDFLELKESPNFKSALKFYQDIARQYAYFNKKLHNSNEAVAKKMKKFFTYREYCWAVSTVMTRLNIVPTETNHDVCSNALIPLWDMCNHTNGQITTIFNVELNQAECFALKDFNEGEQILIFYGKRTNAFFFLYNGFVYPGNEHDALTITLGISPNDPLEDIKKKLLLKIDIKANTVFQVLSTHPPLSNELLAFSRVFCMDKENLQYWMENNADSLKWFENDLIKPEIEKKAFAFINMRCKLLLKSYEVNNLSSLLNSVNISDGESKFKISRNENHRNLIKALKESEMKLLKSTIDYTQTKL